MAEAPKRIYENIMAQASKLFAAESFSIALCGPGPNQITYELVMDRGVRRVPQSRELGDGLSEIVIRTGKPLLVRDFEQEDGDLPLSWMGAPMLSAGKVVGLLTVQCPRQAGYERRDLTILSVLAGWAGSLVESEQLYRTIKQEAESSSALLRVTRALGGETDERHILRSAVEIVPTVLDCDRCSSWWWDGARLVFEPAFRCSAAGRRAEELSSALLSAEGVPALQRVLDTLDVVAVGSSDAGQLGNLRDSLSLELQAVALVPLIAGGELAGLIAVVRVHEGAEFGSRETDLLRGLADIVALALQNLRHYRQQGEASALRELNEMKSRLISTISHELRTPLSFVQAGSELLMQRLLDPEQLRQVAGLVNQGSSRLAEIVDDIIQFADLQSGPVIISPQPTDPVLTVREAIEEAAGLVSGQRVQLETPQPLPVLSLDREKVKSVVVRLIRNALNFSGEQSAVGVGLSVVAGKLLIAITDRGVGIPQNEVERVFEPFFRGEASQNTSVPGAGLGLSIVKQLVDAMGGEVTVNSRTGEGTTVEVSVPLDGRSNGSGSGAGHSGSGYVVKQDGIRPLS